MIPYVDNDDLVRTLKSDPIADLIPAQKGDVLNKVLQLTTGSMKTDVHAPKYTAFFIHQSAALIALSLKV
jgi:hypothetical protein